MSFFNVLVFGDSYRYQFLRSLLPIGTYSEQCLHTENLKQYHCLLAREAEMLTEYRGRKEYLLFSSPSIPAFTKVIFPQEGMADWPDMTPQTKTIIFDEIPYTTASELDNAKTLVRKYYATLWNIFLVPSQQKTAKTDVSTGKEALQKAKKLLIEKGYPVEIYSGNAAQVLLWDLPGEGTRLRWRNSLIQISAQAKERFQNFPLDYQLFLRPVEMVYLAQNTYRGLTKFSKELPYSNVYEIFYQKSEDYYFKGNGKDVFSYLLQSVQYILQDYPWWDEAEISELEANIKNSFRDTVGRLITRNLVFEGRTEKEYEKFCQRSNADTNFLIKLDFFFKGNGTKAPANAPLYQTIEKYIQLVLKKGKL